MKDKLLILVFVVIVLEIISVVTTTYNQWKTLHVAESDVRVQLAVCSRWNRTSVVPYSQLNDRVQLDGNKKLICKNDCSIYRQ